MSRVDELIKEAEETATRKEEEARELCNGLVSKYFHARELLKEADEQRRVAEKLRKQKGIVDDRMVDDGK